MPNNTRQMRRKILISESKDFNQEALTKLRDEADVLVGQLDRASLLASLSEIDVLWVRLGHRVDREVFEAGPRLRFVVTNTTGLNHVDLEEASRRQIQVLSLQGETEFLRNVRATAEHTLALALALVRHLPDAIADVKAGNWQRDKFRGNELFGRTAGVLGYGRLGRIVARYLLALEMRVIVCDPRIQELDIDKRVTVLPLRALLNEADLVTLHVSLTQDTYSFFGRREFEAMKQGAWFINTARGELIDESALLHALQTGKIAGAALDVLDQELCMMLRERPLISYASANSNLIITPHIGGCTTESSGKTELFLADLLLKALASV